MPSVFISYSREDIVVANKIERFLAENGLSVWRDQSRIYGGEQWPRAIGEAISSNDFILLIWSKDAAGSHFVEFEWTTAIALRKTILPCLVDDTPLPPSLRAIHHISLKHYEDAISWILKSLEGPPVETDSEHQGEVLKKLGEIKPSEPEEVLQAVGAIFSQQGWDVRGDVYQAGGDIYVQIGEAPEKREKKLWEKWQAWVTLCIGLLTVTSLLLDLPQKLDVSWGSIKGGDGLVVQALSGTIWDEGNEPLEGVTVTLPEYNLTVNTDRAGRFEFRVKAAKQRSVDLIAQRDGYETHHVAATLGNPAFNFKMRRKE